MLCNHGAERQATFLLALCCAAVQRDAERQEGDEGLSSPSMTTAVAQACKLTGAHTACGVCGL